MNYKENSPTSEKEYKFMDIYSILKTDINKGVFMPGAKLPAEKQLSTQYNVKRFTVRKAIQKLIGDGLVFIIRNKGYYVTLYEININIRKECSYTKSMTQNNLIPKVDLLGIRTISPDIGQKELFALDETDKLWELHVLRYYKNIPFFIGKSYIPFKRTPEFNLHYMETMSIHKVLQEVYGITPFRKSSVCRSTLSDKTESKLLSIFEHSPILKVSNINVDQNDMVIEQSTSTFRADIVQIRVNL